MTSNRKEELEILEAKLEKILEPTEKFYDLDIILKSKRDLFHGLGIKSQRDPSCTINIDQLNLIYQYGCIESVFVIANLLGNINHREQMIMLLSDILKDARKEIDASNDRIMFGPDEKNKPVATTH